MIVTNHPLSPTTEKIAQLKKHTRRSHKNCMALLSENFWDVERVVKLINKAKK